MADAPFKVQSASSVLERTHSGHATDKMLKQEMLSNGVTDSSESSGGFLDMLEKSVDKVNTMQIQSDQAVQELVAGRTKNIHESMLAIERADMSLKMLMQVRNKILDAYREIMKMQV